MTTSSPARETAGVYGEIVEGYIREHRARLRGQLAYFGSLQVAQAISQAARGEYPTGQRHPHQYRVRLDALLESERRLRTCESELVSVESFDKLINLIGSIIQSIPGIGELAVYDVSIRIGAHLGIEPSEVYLHRGTRLGAASLGLDTRRASVSQSQLPPDFEKLTAAEIEDLLCIYKEELRLAARGERTRLGVSDICKTPVAESSTAGSRCHRVVAKAVKRRKAC